MPCFFFKAVTDAHVLPTFEMNIPLSGAITLLYMIEPAASVKSFAAFPRVVHATSSGHSWMPCSFVFGVPFLFSTRAIFRASSGVG